MKKQKKANSRKKEFYSGCLSAITLIGFLSLYWLLVASHNVIEPLSEGYQLVSISNTEIPMFSHMSSDDGRFRLHYVPDNPLPGDTLYIYPQMCAQGGKNCRACTNCTLSVFFNDDDSTLTLLKESALTDDEFIEIIFPGEYLLVNLHYTKDNITYDGKIRPYMYHNEFYVPRQSFFKTLLLYKENNPYIGASLLIASIIGIPMLAISIMGTIVKRIRFKQKKRKKVGMAS